jgi:hypothetical protein
MDRNYNPMTVRTHISLCGAIIYTASALAFLYIQSIITGTSSPPMLQLYFCIMPIIVLSNYFFKKQRVLNVAIVFGIGGLFLVGIQVYNIFSI